MSPSTIALIFLIINILYLYGNANTIYADTASEYRSGTITCNTGEPCTVICNANEACHSATINCPSGQTCDIECISPDDSNKNVCRDAIFNCQDSSRCDILCQGENGWSYSCQGTTFNWPTNDQYSLECKGGQSCYDLTIDIPDDDTILNYDCSYGTHGCFATTLNCPANADCNIDCSAEFACHSMTVNCPTNANSQCNIICNGYEACQNAKFNGQGVVTACNQPRSCVEAKLPIPPSDYNLVLNCSHSDSCGGADVRCPSDASCEIFCDGGAACSNTNITWPTGSGTYTTSVTCSDAGACSGFTLPPSGTVIYLDSTASPTTFQPTTTTTLLPTTSNPTTVIPTTALPTTSEPTTNPTTANPTTVNPTTTNPTTYNPTTVLPTTTNPTTMNPTTTNPTTYMPTTSTPTTSSPTPVNPSTATPTSATPTTSSPTTSTPTTAHPNTFMPTTATTIAPTTTAPTTEAPTNAPIDGITISLAFNYTTANATDIDILLQDILQELIKQSIINTSQSDCGNFTVNIQLQPSTNTESGQAKINATVPICDEKDIQQLINYFKTQLQSDIIDDATEDGITLIATQEIIVEKVALSKETDETTSTTSTTKTIQEPSNAQTGISVDLVIIFMAIVVGLLTIIVLLLFCLYRRKSKEANDLERLKSTELEITKPTFKTVDQTTMSVGESVQSTSAVTIQNDRSTITTYASSVGSRSPGTSVATTVNTGEFRSIQPGTITVFSTQDNYNTAEAEEPVVPLDDQDEELYSDNELPDEVEDDDDDDDDDDEQAEELYNTNGHITPNMPPQHVQTPGQGAVNHHDPPPIGDV